MDEAYWPGEEPRVENGLPFLTRNIPSNYLLWAAMTDPAQKTYRFPKEERLHSKKKIEELFKNGSSLRIYPFTIKYLLESQVGNNRILVSVPKKFHKKAVVRNRIKRRVKEAYRLNKHLLTENDAKGFLIAFLYLSDKVLDYKDIETKLITILKRLSKTRTEEKDT